MPFSGNEGTSCDTRNNAGVIAAERREDEKESELTMRMIMFPIVE